LFSRNEAKGEQVIIQFLSFTKTKPEKQGKNNKNNTILIKTTKPYRLFQANITFSMIYRKEDISEWSISQMNCSQNMERKGLRGEGEMGLK